jgi:tetratricopeptide (TPR) repeat protein
LLLWHWLRTAPKAAWFLALALLGLLPVSNLVPVPTMTVAPYRAAAAGLGVAALLGYALSGIADRNLARHQNRLLVLACGLLGLAYLFACTGLSAWSAAQWSDQMNLCQTLVRYDPDSLFARNNLIGAYMDTNQPKRAGQQAEAMLTRLFGSQIWRQPQAAMSLFRKNDSIAYYIRQSIGEKSPTEAWVGTLYARLGTAWQERGDLKSSQACLAASLLFDPGTIDVNVAVGKYDCAVGKYAEAIPYLRYAQSSYASIPDPYLLLGEAYSALGQWEQAKRQYQGVIGLEPWLGPAYLGLANAQRHLGDTAGAEATLQAAKRRAILSPEQAMRMLDTNLRSTR